MLQTPSNSSLQIARIKVVKKKNPYILIEQKKRGTDTFQVRRTSFARFRNLCRVWEHVEQRTLTYICSQLLHWLNWWGCVGGLLWTMQDKTDCDALYNGEKYNDWSPKGWLNRHMPDDWYRSYLPPRWTAHSTYLLLKEYRYSLHDSFVLIFCTEKLIENLN